MIAFNATALGAAAISIVLADLRWLRVAQHEHYLPGSAARFGWRWWTSTPLNSLSRSGCDRCRAAATAPITAVATGAVVAAGPAGLRLAVGTLRLAWTRRVSQVAAVTVTLEGLGIALDRVLGGLSDAVVAAASSAIRRSLVHRRGPCPAPAGRGVFAQRYVGRATTVLARVRPLVVGITGSYGKTTTKNYVAHLLGS